MAKLIINEKEIEIEDGAEIKKHCEEAGIPFGCESGLCRTCEVDVVEGHENLSGLTDNEKDMYMDEKTRLACQCKVKSGTVKIKPKWDD